jgi:hypothetical protein
MANVGSSAGFPGKIQKYTAHIDKPHHVYNNNNNNSSRNGPVFEI